MLFAGIDNYHDSADTVFQGEEAFVRLIECLDLDVDNFGQLWSRVPFAESISITSPLGLWEIGSRVFLQDGAVLSELIGGETISLVTGLQQRVAIAYHGDRFYLTDGTSHWMLINNTAMRWGVPIPSLLVSATSGDLESGRYLIQATYSNAAGDEGGASPVYVITGTGAKVQAINANDPSIARVNIYTSGLNQKVPTYHSSYDPAELPVWITTTPPTRGDAAKAELIGGPISNTTQLFSWRAFLFMVRGSYIFRSEAHEPHLFDGENFMQFGSTVRAAGAVKDGMWIGTARGLSWVTGENPEQWIPALKLFSSIAKGCLETDGYHFPQLQTADRVCIFIAKDGVVAALPGGNVVHLTKSTYHFDPDREYRLSIGERSGIKQLRITVI